MNFLPCSTEAPGGLQSSPSPPSSVVQSIRSEVQTVNKAQSAKVVPFPLSGGQVKAAIAEVAMASVSPQERMAWKKRALVSQEYARILRKGGSLSL